jgi:hypothetical protein
MFEPIKGNVFFMDQRPQVGQSLHIMESSLSHSDTPHSEGLLCKSDQSFAETTIFDITTQSQQSLSMFPAGFEQAIPAIEQLQNHALDRAATGMGKGHVVPF